MTPMDPHGAMTVSSLALQYRSFQFHCPLIVIVCRHRPLSVMPFPSSFIPFFFSSLISSLRLPPSTSSALPKEGDFVEEQKPAEEAMPDYQPLAKPSEWRRRHWHRWAAPSRRPATLAAAAMGCPYVCARVCVCVWIFCHSV
eukprot:GHVU01056373.1.p1 GENE.GHVU01056373.1~~GHVU01056373.1.p1  ORF type:complete len:142 (-),score=11.74 GHVU01056373.1:74-499(-)